MNKTRALLIIFIFILVPSYVVAEYNYSVQEDYLPIYGYHRIISDNGSIKEPSNELYQSDFEEQVKFLTENMNCKWITFSQAMTYINNKDKLPNNVCVMTFDDGTHYEYENALPILDKYNITATFYIISGRVGTKGCNGCEIGHYYMHWDELNKLYGSGHEIGAHTVDVFTGINAQKLDYNSIKFQVQESKLQLESHGYSVSTFAYPLGQWNIDLINLLEETNYLGGRDTIKDNTWRDRRPVTVWSDESILDYDSTSYNNNSGINNMGKWHMFYYKPETKTLEEIRRETSYNGWWQFEDQYQTEIDSNNNIRVLSSVKVDNNSFGIIDLQDNNDKIASLFILPAKDSYLIQVFLETGDKSNPYSMISKIKLFVDDESYVFTEDNISNCILSETKYFCYLNIELNLSQGVHKLSVQTKTNNLMIDRFRIYSLHNHSKTFESKYVKFDKLSNIDKLKIQAGIFNNTKFTKNQNITYISPLNTQNDYEDSNYEQSIKSNDVSIIKEESITKKLIIKIKQLLSKNNNLIDKKETQTISKINTNELTQLYDFNCPIGYTFVETLCKDIDECLNNPCEINQTCYNIIGSYMCGNNHNESAYSKIYNTYPLNNEDKEVLYSYLLEGDISVADAFLENNFLIPRYHPIQLKMPLNWTEDPYDEKYWRYVHYSLRETRHLIYAYEMTGDEKYYLKLREIIEGFIDDGIVEDDLNKINNKTLTSCDNEKCWFVWDYHSTAFRTLMLTQIWWQLREEKKLDSDLSEKILSALEIHGNYLLDEKHYQPQYNHGISEASALYVLAVNFPDLQNADLWLNVSQERILTGLDAIVDSDGVLVENSPYYQFYVLKLYWDIDKYLEKINETYIKPIIDKKIKSMVSYGIYIIQPDLETPLIGASLRNEIKLKQEFVDIAKTNDEFLYVLTSGKNGSQPKKMNVHYPIAGQTIMRSGWKSGIDYVNQTQIVFDVGNYRTDHSDLDSLSFQLFGEGIALLPDAGLYSYEDSPYKDYFHGTSAHNTIVIDGINQRAGETYAGLFYENNSIVYQSGQHILYAGVIHQRGILMLDKNKVLIIDNIVADDYHQYELFYHFFPGMEVSTYNFTIMGEYKNGEKITLHSILNDNVSVKSYIGNDDPFIGWCSWEYEKKIPCYAVVYSKNTTSTAFVTLIEIGEPENNLKVNVMEFSKDEILINITAKHSQYFIQITDFLGENESVIVEK